MKQRLDVVADDRIAKLGQEPSLLVVPHRPVVLGILSHHDPAPRDPGKLHADFLAVGGVVEKVSKAR